MPPKEKSKQDRATELSFREQLLGTLPDGEKTTPKREVSVMTRMSGDVVEILDAMVELNIFSSKSEAVSAFVVQAISSRKSMFEEIKKQAKEIRKMRDTAKKHAYEVFQEESS